VSATADVVLIPEIPFDIEKVCEKIVDREARGRRFSIVVVAEGAKPAGGEMVARDQGAGREVLLGGIAEQVAHEIGRRTGKETRTVVLGHLQRGGRPTTFDRLLALRFGAAAVRMVEERKFGAMVALDPPDVHAVPLEVATERMKDVPLNGDTILTARDLGICLGD
jgi:6-phosphofructokinase 1